VIYSETLVWVSGVATDDEVVDDEVGLVGGALGVALVSVVPALVGVV
jgi:hypothetical protein